MGKESGRNVLLMVGDGNTDPGPEAFNELGGQVETRLRHTGTSEDASTKQSGPWLERIPIDVDSAISCNGRADWPDSDGLDALRKAFEGKQTINCEIILDTSGQKYTGPWTVEQLEIGGAKGGITEYAVELASAGDQVYTAGT